MANEKVNKARLDVLEKQNLIMHAALKEIIFDITDYEMRMEGSDYKPSRIALETKKLAQRALKGVDMSRKVVWDKQTNLKDMI